MPRGDYDDFEGGHDNNYIKKWATGFTSTLCAIYINSCMRVNKYLKTLLS
jgi:hypothetical protein